jgi:hypothetical protein
MTLSSSIDAQKWRETSPWGQVNLRIVRMTFKSSFHGLIRRVKSRKNSLGMLSNDIANREWGHSRRRYLGLT